jgi:hypothetical protein
VLLRMYEKFSGCKILSYSLMSNHLHVLLEVPPGCEKGRSLGLSEEELLRRLGGLYSRNYTAAVAREIEEAKGLILFEYRRILISGGRTRECENEAARGGSQGDGSREGRGRIGATLGREGAGFDDLQGHSMPGPLFHGWRGDWIEEFCRRGV